MKKLLPYKKAGFAALSLFLTVLSADAVAQKSVYDVVPGSGPQKTEPTAPKGVYDVVPGSGPGKAPAPRPVVTKGSRNHDGVYRDYKVRRRNLPPGQAKKIYGGSATDYAPGQVKKREGEHRKGHWKKHGHRKGQHHKHRKSRHHDD